MDINDCEGFRAIIDIYTALSDYDSISINYQWGAFFILNSFKDQSDLTDTKYL